MRRIRSIQFVLWLALGAAAAGCGQPAPGSDLGQSQEMSEVTASLTTVPSGVLCVKLALSGSVSSSLMLTVASGASSASLSLGSVPAGNLTVTPSAFNVACSSVTSSTVPTWTGPAVTVTVVAGTPLVVPLTLQPFGATAAVNFVPFVKAVGAGSYSSYALLSDGTVRAWGHNGMGQLGDGTVTHRSTPVAVSGLSGVASLATNGQGYHSCAVKTGGSAWCWGWNAYGQLGNNTTTSSSVPVAVTGGYLFRQISQGYSHACGVTTSGYVTCWGSNSSGQFGNYTSTSSLVPIAPMYPLIAAVEEVQCGASFSCVRGGNQEVACTGDNYSGQLGTGNTTSTNYWTANSLRTPATLPAGIGLGAYHACAVVPVDGSMRCVGDNEFGELGDGTTTDRYSAVAVSGLSGVTAIAAGNYFTCALKSDGTVWCWGYNYYGELGDRTEVSRPTPAPVYGLSQVVSIAAGETHVCVAKADGTAWCWGQNANGELGDATMTNRAQPAKVVF